MAEFLGMTDKVLGFANKWNPEAASHAIQITLEEGPEINIFSAVYFIATKLEAFTDRGENEGRFSIDFEDIVFILNNRKDIWKELADTTGELKRCLQEELTKLLNESYLDEWISSRLDYQDQKRVSLIMGSLREFIGN